jgi:tetratricopeptide (TPR) repeat protein
MMLPRASIARLLSCALALATLTIAATCVRAQEGEDAADPNSPTERARVHFRNGVDFYHEGNFRAALIEFKRAYKASPHYKLLYNLGQASLELQEDGPAIEYFTNYLREGAEELSAERRREVEQDIARLQARLAHAIITTNQDGAEIYVDDGLVGTSPLREPLKLSVGRRRITAIKSGFITAERTLDVASGDNVAIALELKERDQDLSKLRFGVNSSGRDGAPLSPAAWAGIATGVVGAAALTFTILTAVAQADFDNERKKLTSADDLQNMRDDTKVKALGADIAWGATIVAAGITTVLLITNSGPERTPSDDKQGIKVELGAGSLHLRGRF